MKKVFKVMGNMTGIFMLFIALASSVWTMPVQAEAGSNVGIDTGVFDAYILGQMSKHGIRGISIAFAELPTYFSSCMPRLFGRVESQAYPSMGWVAWLLASFFLAAQHMFPPLILDGGFMLWRFGMFLPFALFMGFVIKLRPTLLPYFMIIHALKDVTTVFVYLMI